MNSKMSIRSQYRPPAKDWRENPCFYVSVVDGPKLALLAGPFQAHQAALDLVEKASDIAQKKEPWAWFYAFGTVKTKTGQWRGKLNDELGITLKGVS